MQQSSTLPNEPFFTRILARARSISDPVLRDNALNIHVGFTQLFTDVIHTCDELRKRINQSLFDGDGMLLEANAYVGLWTAANYEFYVAALAILAIGGAIVPLRPEFRLEESLVVLKECGAHYLLLGHSQAPLSDEIQEIGSRMNHTLQTVPVTILANAPTDLATLKLSIADSAFPTDRPSLLIHTTGTSGPPKKVVHTRRLFDRVFPTHPNDLILMHENLDWISATVTIVIRVLTGAKGEIMPTNPAPAVIWARLRQGGVTGLAGHSFFWQNLGRYYLEHIEIISAPEKEPFIRGAHGVVRPFIAGSAPEPWLLPFWKHTFERNIQAGYVATELGVITMMTSPDSDPHVERALGKPLPGILAKLSPEDRGEILMKSPFIFSHYLNNPNATAAAFDEEGYFKTGDLGHWDGEQYIFEGRFGADCKFSGISFVDRYEPMTKGTADRVTNLSVLELNGEMISILNLDMQLIKKNYIREVYCIPFRERKEHQMGILVRFQKSNGKDHENNIDWLGNDVRNLLKPHVVSLRVRVLGDEEDIPRTFNKKIWRRVAADQFFQ